MANMREDLQQKTEEALAPQKEEWERQKAEDKKRGKEIAEGIISSLPKAMEAAAARGQHSYTIFYPYHNWGPEGEAAVIIAGWCSRQGLTIESSKERECNFFRVTWK